jgi:hypothetical protein
MIIGVHLRDFRGQNRPLVTLDGDVSTTARPDPTDAEVRRNNAIAQLLLWLQ